MHPTLTARVPVENQTASAAAVYLASAHTRARPHPARTGLVVR